MPVPTERSDAQRIQDGSAVRAWPVSHFSRGCQFPGIRPAHGTWRITPADGGAAAQPTLQPGRPALAEARRLSVARGVAAVMRAGRLSEAAALQRIARAGGLPSRWMRGWLDRGVPDRYISALVGAINELEAELLGRTDHTHQLVRWEPHKIRALRDQLGATHRKFAALLHVHYKSVAKWEHGTSRPSAGHCVRLSRLAENLQRGEEAA